MKALPFFQTVNWDALYERRVEMPYRPDLKDLTDISSFEATFTKEAPIDSVVDNNNNSNSNKGKKKGGIMGYFGRGGGANNASNGEDADDVFKGFTFARDEEAGGNKDKAADGADMDAE